MLRAFCLMVMMFSGIPAYAFTCYLTVVKDNCWENYNVTVSAEDVKGDHPQLVTVIVPEGSLWARQKFNCQPGQSLRFNARYTPIFWESERGKVHYLKHYWNLPKEVKAGESAWNITLCFPKQFSQVPLPPEATSSCKCDLKNVPPVPPQ